MPTRIAIEHQAFDRSEPLVGHECVEWSRVLSEVRARLLYLTSQ